MKIHKPSIGRNVEYTSTSGKKHLAFVVGLVSPNPSEVNLLVALDGPNDAVFEDVGAVEPHALVWRGTVPHDDAGSNGTWRYPPRVTEEIETVR